MKNSVISACVLIMLVVFFMAGYYWGRQSTPFVVTEVHTDTLTTYLTITDTLKPVFSVRKIPSPQIATGGAEGSVLSASSAVHRDSLFPDSNSASDDERFVYSASIDTLLSDSTLSVSLAFHSPAPLHPASYFTVAARIRQRDIHRYTVISAQDNFSDRFGIGVIAGYAYMPAADKGGIVAGVGISFRVW